MYILLARTCVVQLPHEIRGKTPGLPRRAPRINQGEGGQTSLRGRWVWVMGR